VSSVGSFFSYVNDARSHEREAPHSSLSPARHFQSRIPRICNTSLWTTFFHLVLGFPTDLVLRNCSYCPFNTSLNTVALYHSKLVSTVNLWALREFSMKKFELNCRRKQIVESRGMPAFCVTKF